MDVEPFFPLLLGVNIPSANSTLPVSTWIVLGLGLPVVLPRSLVDDDEVDVDGVDGVVDDFIIVFINSVLSSILP